MEICPKFKTKQLIFEFSALERMVDDINGVIKSISGISVKLI